jgi:hypothetical protein
MCLLFALLCPLPMIGACCFVFVDSFPFHVGVYLVVLLRFSSCGMKMNTTPKRGNHCLGQGCTDFSGRLQPGAKRRCRYLLQAFTKLQRDLWKYVCKGYRCFTELPTVVTTTADNLRKHKLYVCRVNDNCFLSQQAGGQWR